MSEPEYTFTSAERPILPGGPYTPALASWRKRIQPQCLFHQYRQPGDRFAKVDRFAAQIHRAGIGSQSHQQRSCKHRNSSANH